MKTPYSFFLVMFISVVMAFFVGSCSSKKIPIQKTETPPVKKQLVWHENLEKALVISKKEKKPIMMFFTGSDWCGWCIRLQKEVFFKEDFKNWAQENVVLLELDFPRRKSLAPDIKAQNMKLQSQFAIRGYPTVWFVTPDKDAQGNVQWVKLGRTGYVAGGPGAWISNANALLGAK